MHLKTVLALNNMSVNIFKEFFLSFLYELQNSVETNISRNKSKKIIMFWLNGDRLKTPHYESYRKTNHKNDNNIKEYHIFG